MNDAVSWLPGNAESTRVIQASAQFQPKDEIPAKLVYERAGGVTTQDMASVTAQIAKFNALAPVARPSVGPIPSRDKSAIRVEVPINAGSAGWDKLSAAVTDMRSIATASPAGLSVHFTGPGGFAADSSAAFSGIDGKLLYSALAVVIFILLITYRSPVLWLLPVVSAGLALTVAQAVVYLLARNGLTVNAQSAGILTVLVFGAGTDYALLLVARYREELRRHEDRHEAMAFALHRVGPAIFASGSTVIAGMLCLLVASMNSTQGLGPVAAVGIAVGLMVMLTLLPALLVIFGTPDSVVGEQVLADHFPAGAGQPVTVIANADRATAVRTAMTGVGGISGVAPPVVKGDRALLAGTLAVAPDSQAAIDTVGRARDAVHQVPGAQAIVGGDSATRGDILQAASNDNKVIIPLILFVVFLILMLLLRAVVAPLILIGTVVLSFGAAMGLSSLVFRHVFNFAGADSSLPLFVFVFLVALGIDYNIFLMTRVHEEARQFGTRRGALIGLAATGGVITSAGLVLAGTFSVLATLPVVAFAEIGFAVALGVLLDTLIVRSVLVTALNLDVGRHMWWPSSLANKPDSEELPRPATVTHRGAASGAFRRTQTD